VPDGRLRYEAMADNPADLRSGGGGASPDPSGRPGRRLVEPLDESECLRLIGAGRIGRLAYTGRYGPTVLPVVYKLHEGSIVFHTFQDTFTEEDLRTGIAYAEYQVAFEIDQFDLEPFEGWTVVVMGPAHHVDTEAERASIISAGAEPWPEAAYEHLIRVQPIRIGGRRVRMMPADR
jgi:nitroimidazol reductase NimA-like FMN-containing flavoprotein (pyridoxamine 5'-phosphate oxidase superfamily)